MVKFVDRFVGILVAVALILALLITSVEAVVYWMPGYFEHEYEKHQVLDDVDMEMEDLLKVTEHMMAYLRGDKENLQICTAIGNSPYCPFFSPREILHMEDVKVLFLGGIALRRISLVILAAGVLLLWKRKTLRSLPGSICLGTGIFFGATCVIAGLAATDFTHYFTIFHHIFFDNDLWLLNPRTDRLINIVPEPFFIDTAAAIALTFGLSMAVILASSVWLHRKWKRTTQTIKK